MLLAAALVIVSLGLLFVGAEGLVRGSVRLASRIGISPLIVGLTIVAFGTSSPELVVSAKAALAGKGDIALGNVLGSNSFNIGVILGLTALICPIPVHLQIIKLDAPVALVVALLLPFLALDGTLTRLDALFLFCALLAYLSWSVRAARQVDAVPAAVVSPGPPMDRSHWIFDGMFIVAGLGLLVIGSNLLVDKAVLIAKALEVSDAIIGLTIIAAGTSMPELATSVTAAIRRQPDIAIGNVIGSNIFNVVGILGISGLISPLAFEAIQSIDYLTVILFSLLLFPLLHTGKKLVRLEGGLLLSIYVGYLWILWP